MGWAVRLSPRSRSASRAGSHHRSIAVAVGVVCALVLAAGCSSDGGADGPVPKIADFDPALDAVEQHYGSTQPLFEVSANLGSVTVVVARPAGDSSAANTYSAESFSFADGTLTGPTVLGDAQGEVFPRDKIKVDRDRIFSGLRSELSDPVISDFAVTGASDGEVIYDATVLSDKGGQLRVRVAEDGRVLGVMAE